MGLKQSIGRAKSNMVRKNYDNVSDMFESIFGLREGSMVEIMNKGGNWKTATIIAVEDCYYNRRGGHTANLKVARINANGTLGVGRSLILVCRKGKVTGLGNPGDRYSSVTCPARKVSGVDE